MSICRVSEAVGAFSISGVASSEVIFSTTLGDSFSSLDSMLTDLDSEVGFGVVTFGVVTFGVGGFELGLGLVLSEALVTLGGLIGRFLLGSAKVAR